MKRLISIGIAGCLILLGGCDSGVSVEPEAAGPEVATKGGAVKNHDIGYTWCIEDGPDYYAMSDMPIPCFTGDDETWTRTVGCLTVDGTRIETPGGRLVINWKVNYDESFYDVYEIDGYGGTKVEDGGAWRLVDGHQTAHDVANVADWTSDDVFEQPYSSGEGMHRYTLNETYEDLRTGKKRHLVLPMLFQYDGHDDLYNPNITAMPTMQRLMKHGFCPGQSRPK